MSTEWLRQEHIDAQKKRVKLIQWKLVVVATLGATALGFTGSNAAPNSDLVLCCIPFVCCYADALIYHNGIISHVIGEFIRKHDFDPILAKYEDFSLEVRKMQTIMGKRLNAYALERLTLDLSSIAFCLAISVYKVLYWTAHSAAIIGAGLVGILASFLLRRAYENRRRQIRPLLA
jgi:hypothetical protein